MSRPDPFRDDLLARLAALDGLRGRAMFGGCGLYAGSTFFGIVYRGRFYLKTTADTRGEFTSRGMGPFRPSATQTLWDYYEVPPEVLGDDARLVEWARESVERVRGEGG